MGYLSDSPKFASLLFVIGSTVKIFPISISPIYFSFLIIPNTVVSDYFVLPLEVRYPCSSSSLPMTEPPLPSKYLLKMYLTILASSSFIEILFVVGS